MSVGFSRNVVFLEDTHEVEIAELRHIDHQPREALCGHGPGRVWLTGRCNFRAVSPWGRLRCVAPRTEQECRKPNEEGNGERDRLKNWSKSVNRPMVQPSRLAPATITTTTNLRRVPRRG